MIPQPASTNQILFNPFRFLGELVLDFGVSNGPTRNRMVFYVQLQTRKRNPSVVCKQVDHHSLGFGNLKARQNLLDHPRSAQVLPELLMCLTYKHMSAIISVISSHTKDTATDGLQPSPACGTSGPCPQKSCGPPPLSACPQNTHNDTKFNSVHTGTREQNAGKQHCAATSESCPR